MLVGFKRRALDLMTELALRTPIRHSLLGAGSSRAVIFTLHRVASPEHGIDGHDMEALATLLIRLRQLDIPILGLTDILDRMRQHGTLPKVCVSFTVDDGYWDQAQHTVPLLLEHGASPTVFLITGFLDGKLWPWDAHVREAFRAAQGTRLRVEVPPVHVEFAIDSREAHARSLRAFMAICKSVADTRREELVTALERAVGTDPGRPPPPHQRPMTWDQARTLEDCGASFGSHSVSHCVISRVSAEKAAAELEISHRRITEELQQPTPILAWPIGRPVDFGDRDLALAVRAGYKACANVFSRDVILAPDHSSSTPVCLHRHGFSGATGEALRLIYGMSASEVRESPVSPARRAGFTGDRALDWSRVRRLVYVCKGNICRSVYAEARAQAAGIAAASCGIEAAPGAEADAEATRNALVRGIDLSSHRSRRLDEFELSSTDLLVYMEPVQSKAVMHAATKAGAQHTPAARWVKTALEETRLIPDPYGKDDVVFQAVFEQLDEVVGSLSANVCR